MNRPYRVLQVLGGTDLGGAESRVMDSYRHIERERIQFDFCVHTEKKGYFDEEIESLGGRIYRIPRFQGVNLAEYRRAWKDFFKEHPGYLAVHGHMTSTASLYLPIAKKAGVPLTIAHARSAGVDPGVKGLATKALRFSLGKKADVCLTCSALAGEAVFGKKMTAAGRVTTVPNAIDAAAFTYAPAQRERIRREYGIGGDTFVIGHVGRFGHMKNHMFLVEVFDKVLKQRPDARLLLVGEGALIGQVREKAERLHILEQIIFAGKQGNISPFYQAMDYFGFPSVFEGLPGTVIEAQAAGLKCLVSDSVTEEVLITPLAQAKPLQAGPEKWAETVLSGSGYERTNRTEEIIRAGFDVSDQVKMLTKLYLQETDRL